MCCCSWDSQIRLSSCYQLRYNSAMRRSLSKFPYSSAAPSSISFSSASAFSTSSGASGGGGEGRGRGRGSVSPKFQLTKEDHSPSSSENPPVTGYGHGHGQGGGARGKPLHSSPMRPPFSSFVDNTAASPSAGGRGRGRGLGGALGSGPIRTLTPAQPSDPSRKPVFQPPHDSHSPQQTESPTVPGRPRNPEESHQTHLPSSILSVLSGAGRGKTLMPPNPVPDRPKQENRHIRAKEDTKRDSNAAPPTRLSQEEAVQKAVGILSRGGEGRGEGGRGFRGVSRGRGARGRGGLQAWRGSGRGRGERRARFEDADDDHGIGLYVGDNADGEKLAQKLGPDIMNQLVESFEEMSSRVLPSPADDAYLDALHTNLLIECEPEYMMGDFATNPDIDEKAPIPLRDALEKMKPFLMAYEGIQSQQEWEEVVEETMKQVPLLKDIVDYYSGPDRVTAKQQQEELERVAKMVPESAPASVKQFTDRAVLSLQSNPGWGFDKKCQLMDKLVSEISQHYK